MNLTVPALKKLFVFALLGVAVFICFSPCFKAGFINWDDRIQSVDHPSAQALTMANVKTIFTETIMGVYVPLTTMSFAVEKAVLGWDPYRLHQDSVLLHLGVVWLALILAMSLGLSLRAAFLAALVFAIHPMHVESVAWITERKDVLYSLFYLGALLAWWKWLDARGSTTDSLGAKAARVCLQPSGYLYLAFLLTAFSLFAKPMALSLPLVMLLVAWYRRGLDRKTVCVTLPFFILAGAIAGITYLQQARVPIASAAQAFLIWPWTLGFYIWKFFLPFIYYPLYEAPLPVTLGNWPYPATLIFLFLVGIFLWRRKGDRLLMFAAAWFFVSVFFLMRFDIHDINIVADRFMYLPSLGLCFWLGREADARMSGERARRAAILAVIGITIFLGMKTYSQCGVWRDPMTFWNYVIAYYPRQEIAYENRAVEHARRGKFDLAVQDHNEALMFAGNKAVIHYNRGMDLKDWAGQVSARGESEKARLLYLRAKDDLSFALALEPRNARAYRNRGDVRFKLGDISGAYADQSRAIQLNPKDALAYYGRAETDLARGRVSEALEDLGRAAGLGLAAARERAESIRRQSR